MVGVLHEVHSLALRVLLHGGSSDEEETDADHAGEEEEHTDDDTKSLRIAAIFIILAAGIVGALPCLFFPVMRSTSHPIPRVLRAFSAGIILALAFVHIYPEAVDELANLEPLMNEDYPYNVAGPTAIFGALLMVALDSAANFFVERRQAQALREQLGGDEGRGAPVSESAATALAAPHAATLVLDPHTHVCAGQARMSLDATPMPRVRDQIMAVLFELGCIFHSFIIGLTLGVNTDNYASVRALVIALSFHQFLEGIALASFIMRARVGRWKGLAMVVLYSLTCPVGIAIGIGVSDSYDPESTQAIATQGVFNAISAGMLLYIGLVQLIAEDFTRREVPVAPAPALPASPSHSPSHKQHELPSAENAPVDKACGHGHGAQAAAGFPEPQSGWWLLACHGALFLGAALMSMIGIWA